MWLSLKWLDPSPFQFPPRLPPTDRQISEFPRPHRPDQAAFHSLWRVVAVPEPGHGMKCGNDVVMWVYIYIYDVMWVYIYIYIYDVMWV